MRVESLILYEGKSDLRIGHSGTSHILTHFY